MFSFFIYFTQFRLYHIVTACNHDSMWKFLSGLIIDVIFLSAAYSESYYFTRWRSWTKRSSCADNYAGLLNTTSPRWNWGWWKLCRVIDLFWVCILMFSPLSPLSIFYLPTRCQFLTPFSVDLIISIVHYSLSPISESVNFFIKIFVSTTWF